MAPTRSESALSAARALVNAFEVDDAPVERCLMLAQRVARLMRDTDAQTWLDYEQRGYAEGAKLDDLKVGSCCKYVYRFDKSGRISVTDGLPRLEALKRAHEITLSKIQSPTMPGTAENYVAAGATSSVIDRINARIDGERAYYVNASSNYARLRAVVHRWASDTLIALELGDVAETIFESARREVDIFVRTHVPKAAEQLLAVNDRMREGTAESLSQALTSCRRLLTGVADAVFPAQSAPYSGADGKARKVGEEQIKNRISAFLETRIRSGSTRGIVDAQLTHLIARLDAVWEKVCKGVHTDVDPREARLVVIETYLFLAEVARYATVSGSINVKLQDATATSNGEVSAPVAPVSPPTADAKPEAPEADDGQENDS